jgi:CIC family chloride channel protein
MDVELRPGRRAPAVTLEDLGFLAIVGLVALLGGASACLFRLGTQGLSVLLFGHGDDMVPAVADLGAIGRVLVPATGGLVAGCMGWLASRQKGGHGVPEIMEAVTLSRGFVSLRATLAKAFAGLVTILSGGSVGREGPIVQVAAAIGSRAGRVLNLGERRVRILTASGCAAGLAAVYDAPIGAILFVAEVVAGTFALELLLPCMTASVFATTVARAVFGSQPIFRVPPFALVSAMDWWGHGLIGLLAGVVGHVFLRTLDSGERVFARLRLPRPLAGALGGAIVGVLGIGLPQIYGNGFEAASQVLEGRFGLLLVVAILLGKAVATSITVGSGAPGGVFTPTLLLGACLGAAMGRAIHLVVPGSVGPEGGYALVGMAAMLAATTHAPVLSTVMIFEMTGNYAIVLPLILSTSLSVLVARRLSPSSVYTRELAKRGIAWEGSIEERLARGITARDIVDPDVILVHAATPFSELRRIFGETHARTIFVGDGERGFLGTIDIHTIKLFLETDELDPVVVAADIVARTKTASPDATLLELAHAVHGLEFGELPVVDPGPPWQFLGVVSRRALLAAFDREILKRDLLVTKVLWREGEELASELLELPEGSRMAEIRVPRELAGHTLSEARIREREGVNVVVVVRPGRKGNQPGCLLPTPDLVLQRGDRLVVVAPQKLPTRSPRAA